MVAIVLAAGCAGPSRRDDSDALRREDAKRELARQCRHSAEAGLYDPDCPRPFPPERPERAPLPSPQVNLPR